jgi:hypothetical protein
MAFALVDLYLSPAVPQTPPVPATRFGSCAPDIAFAVK